MSKQNPISSSSHSMTWDVGVGKVIANLEISGSSHSTSVQLVSDRPSSVWPSMTVEGAIALRDALSAAEKWLRIVQKRRVDVERQIRRELQGS